MFLSYLFYIRKKDEQSKVCAKTAKTQITAGEYMLSGLGCISEKKKTKKNKKRGNSMKTRFFSTAAAIKNMDQERY